MNHHRSAAAATLLAAGAILLTACSGAPRTTDPTKSTSVASTPRSSSSVTTSTTPPNSVTPTTSKPNTSSPGPDPRGQAATAAYLAFVAASHAAEQHPAKLSLEQALSRYAVDPALATEGEHIFGYRQAGIAWRGTPPTSRVNVKAISTMESRTAATLSDCPTVSATWEPYFIKTNKRVPVTYPPGSAKPPHATTATVIYYKHHWMVQKMTTDVKHTCSASS